MRHRNSVLCGVLLIACVAASRANTQAECTEFARTDLERLYCQINAKAPGIVPGTLGEFRKNPPGTQRLLLQRPAARLGLALPHTSPAGRSPPKPARIDSPPETAPQAQAPKAPTAPAVPPAAATSLENCHLRERSIVCGPRQFHRLTNLPNQRLPEGALGPENRLELGPATSPEALYLERSYREYVDRMVSIGLAGVTMSYTKFHHFYAEAARSGTSFAERMAGMFEYLKKDKQALAVDSRGDRAGPATLSACYRLDDEYIICDNVATNWIYRAR